MARLLVASRPGRCYRTNALRVGARPGHPIRSGPSDLLGESLPVAYNPSMTREHKSPGAGFLCTVGLIAVLLLYPLSLFPIAWVDNRNYVPRQGPTSRVVWGYCFPVRYCYDHGPRWFQRGVEWVYGP